MTILKIFTEYFLQLHGLPRRRDSLQRLTIDANGTLYGTVDLGGGASGQCGGGTPPLGSGIVYKLTPNTQGRFTETILYRFQGFGDGAEPEDDRLVIDASGDIFGTTAEGGNSTACPPVARVLPEVVASCSRLPRS
jgi:hypothetical protein